MVYLIPAENSITINNQTKYTSIYNDAKYLRIWNLDRLFNVQKKKFMLENHASQTIRQRFNPSKAI